MLVAAVLVVTGTVALMPFSDLQLSASTSFMPALVAAVTVFDIMSAYLLLGEFRDHGERRSLVMASAYVWSLTVMFGYALAFPGAMFLDPPLALTPSMAPYFYVLWHCGFPLLLALAWAPWPERFAQPVPARGRRRTAVSSTVLAGASGVVMIVLLCTYADTLPALIVGLDTSRMTTITAPVTIPLVAIALMITVRGTWHRPGAERWTSVAVLACLCDLVLTYAAHSRFSVGWYGGRSLTILAAGVVLIAMQASFRQLKARAEREAVLDPLTDLLNRRGALATLDMLMAQARRNDTPLSVLALDLDHFKSINDQYGHDAGDAVLVEVGRVLNTCSRGGDVAARVGGEEFLVVLHNTDSMKALLAGERLRGLIAGVTVTGVQTPVTGSVGVTSLIPQDLDPAALLRRADAALYDAKAHGRNRVESRFLARHVLS